VSDPISPSSIDPTEEVPPSIGNFTAPSVKDIQVLLPQYEILEKLGAGGMGAVYKARQPDLDRIVAIKILPTGMDDQYSFKERFRREARAMARLQHPGIISVFEFGETDSGDDEPLLYIVMEYVEGADLNYLIKNSALDVSQTLAVVSQICEALQYAHEQNIVHRDIKPANIMLNLEGNVKIADFGLAKITSTETTVEPSLTGTNFVMGTLDYLAPEQMAAGGSVDQRADLYAVGVLIYEMLTGQAPRGAFELPSKKVKGLDARLDYVVVHAMASNPDDRFQSANELSTALLKIGIPEHQPELETPTEPETLPPPTSAPPWESATARPMPVPDELKPATQADIQAAVAEAARAAAEAVQTAAQTSPNQKAPSTFWPNLYAAAKTVMLMGIVVLIVIALGVVTFFSWPKISRMITSTPTSTPPPTTTPASTPGSTSSGQWPERQIVPPSATSIPQPSKTTLPPLPPPGAPPPRGNRPPPKKKR
jgi:serine/threonine protein kinase